MEKEVKMLVEEIGHKFFFPAIRTIALMLRGPIRKVLDAINVSHEGLEKVSNCIVFYNVIYVVQVCTCVYCSVTCMCM